MGDRLHRLAERAEISFCVDDLDAAKALFKRFEGIGPKLSVLIEVDSGLKRCELSSEAEVREIAAGIKGMKGLELEGILTHAGHVYSARSPDEVEAIGRAEGELMAAMADGLRSKGIGIKPVSVGSTPTVKHSARVKGVTEVRPGNYVFNNMTQVALDVVPLEFCSLTVLSTMISKPAGDRLIIDAGSKSLSSDRGAHGTQFLDGFRFVKDQGVWISHLSEEHGIIDGCCPGVRIGDRLRIVPNHACTALNLFDRAYLVKGEEVLREITIDARGHSV
ncbi:MAG: alanine racemase [Candidatus Thermoplasmatota archaeon]|jgi:D-serine deaminase-like pyridoxal phosphate-dependent protein|nr:alanine racemase [Candidatus Thermoplasmatota archaeon]